MKISIVTPSYNQGEFIEDTILSVLSQEGDFFIEYFIMDGGSTDNTLEILKHYEKKIGKNQFCFKCRGIDFKWVSEKDKGQTHAINKGFHQATGDIVAWINSDDMYFTNAFNLVANKFLENPDYDFIFGDGDVIDKSGGLQWEWLSRPYNLSLLKSYHFLWNDFTNYILQQGTFWKKSVFEKIGFLDESFHFAMDLEFWIRAGTMGLIFKHLPKKLGKFRKISGTKSLSDPLVFWPDMLEIFRIYNGEKNMSPFLAYFFYNTLINSGYKMDAIGKIKNELFKQWNKLGKYEINILEKKVKKGIKKALLLAMNKAYFECDRPIAIAIFKEAIKISNPLILHPLTLIFVIKLLLGRKISKMFAKFKVLMIDFYKKKKYQYRYVKKAKERT